MEATEDTPAAIVYSLSNFGITRNPYLRSSDGGLPIIIAHRHVGTVSSYTSQSSQTSHSSGLFDGPGTSVYGGQSKGGMFEETLKSPLEE